MARLEDNDGLWVSKDDMCVVYKKGGARTYSTDYESKNPQKLSRMYKLRLTMEWNYFPIFKYLGPTNLIEWND